MLFCNLDVLCGDLGIGKLWCLIKKNFLVIKTLDPYWIRDPDRYHIQPKMLDPDPYQMITDPKPCIL
jgi:hypothetical protein